MRVDSLEIVSEDPTSGVMHVRGPGSLFIGETEKGNPYAVGLWNLWVDTRNDFLIPKATFMYRSGTVYRVVSDTSAELHLNRDM